MVFMREVRARGNSGTTPLPVQLRKVHCSGPTTFFALELVRTGRIEWTQCHLVCKMCSMSGSLSRSFNWCSNSWNLRVMVCKNGTNTLLTNVRGARDLEIEPDGVPSLCSLRRRILEIATSARRKYKFLGNISSAWW